MFPQDINADGSVLIVDVWVIDYCCEVDLGWLERVVSWEVDAQEEASSGVWRVIWSHDGGVPMV